MDQICSVCHQPILPSYYFCPNCGTKVNEPPLSTSLAAQAWLYIFSAILPMIAFLTISKWKGLKYFRSQDEKAKKIGIVAFVILIASTILLIYLSYVWTKQLIQSQLDSVNQDLNLMNY